MHRLHLQQHEAFNDDMDRKTLLFRNWSQVLVASVRVYIRMYMNISGSHRVLDDRVEVLILVTIAPK